MKKTSSFKVLAATLVVATALGMTACSSTELTKGGSPREERLEVSEEKTKVKGENEAAEKNTNELEPKTLEKRMRNIEKKNIPSKITGDENSANTCDSSEEEEASSESDNIENKTE